MKAALLLSTIMVISVLGGLLLVYSTIFPNLIWSDTSMLGASIVINYFVPLFFIPLQGLHLLGLFLFSRYLPISVLVMNFFLFIVILSCVAIEKNQIFNLVALGKVALSVMTVLIFCVVWIYWLAWSSWASARRRIKGVGN